MSKLSKIDIFYREASMSKYFTLQRTATYLLSAALVVPLPVFGAGALAIDSRQGSQWGWAINHQTYDEAEQRALRECESRGGSGTDGIVRVWGCDSF